MHIDIPEDAQQLHIDIAVGVAEETNEALIPRLQGEPEAGTSSALFPTAEAKLHFKEIIRDVFDKGMGDNLTLKEVAHELEARGYALPHMDLDGEGEDALLVKAVSNELLQVWMLKQARRSSADPPLNFPPLSTSAKQEDDAPAEVVSTVAAQKRNLSSYLLFANAKRKTLKPGLSVREQGKLLGEMWRNLDKNAKNKYKAKAKAIRDGNFDDSSSSEEDEVVLNDDKEDSSSSEEDKEKNTSSSDQEEKDDDDDNDDDCSDFEVKKTASSGEKRGLPKGSSKTEDAQSKKQKTDEKDKNDGDADDDCSDFEDKTAASIGKKRGKPKCSSNKKGEKRSSDPEAAQSSSNPEAEKSFDEKDLEHDNDLPPAWHALPKEIKAREMEVVWARYSSKEAPWPALVYNPSGVADPLRAMALNCCSEKHLIYFYGSNEWSFVDFKFVKQFGDPSSDVEMAPTAAQMKLLKGRKKELYEIAVRVAKKEVKMKNKWQRASWLCK
jgi:hypothetical protein